MEKYLEDLLKGIETPKAASPATAELFSVDPNSPKLSPSRAEEFHSGVAKVLYLAKRIRPVLLPTVSFLSSRVQNPNEQDWCKLLRLFGYIKQTAHYALQLSAEKPIILKVWIDASYGVHADFKSHTGFMMSLGTGAVCARSAKQRLNTRSSTEAELVGTSDQIPRPIHTRNYLSAQGYDMGPAKVNQDNLSSMALVKAGRPTSDRTRHINIRYFWIADRVESGEISLEFCPTHAMLADGLSKPLQGSALRQCEIGLGAHALGATPVSGPDSTPIL
jgi:hypothetical protein